MIVLVSLIVLLRGFPCFHDFSHGASLHPIFTLVPHIFRSSRICINAVRICAHAYMRSAAHLSRVSLVKWRRSRVHSCCCCYISCVDFVKRPCAWEREAVW